MVKTECHRCEHTWDYTGKQPRGEYCSCPSCSTSVKVGRGHEPEEGEGAAERATDGATGQSVTLETGEIREEMSLAKAIQRVHESALATGQAQEIQRRRLDRLESDLDEIEEAVRELANVTKDWMEKEYPPEEHDWDGVEYEASLLKPRQEFQIPEALRGVDADDGGESAVREAVEGTDTEGSDDE